MSAPHQALLMVRKAGSVALFGSATSVVTGVTCPSSVQAGDLIVFYDSAENVASPAPSSANPSGFTNLFTHTNSANTCRINLSYKVATGSEGGTTIDGMNGNDLNRHMIYVFRPTDVPTPSWAPFSLDSEMPDTAPAGQTITSSGGNEPLVVIAVYRSTGSVTTRSFTPAKDGEINANANMYMAYKIYNAAPADVSISMSDFGNGNLLSGMYFEVS